MMALCQDTPREESEMGRSKVLQSLSGSLLQRQRPKASSQLSLSYGSHGPILFLLLFNKTYRGLKRRGKSRHSTEDGIFTLSWDEEVFFMVLSASYPFFCWCGQMKRDRSKANPEGSQSISVLLSAYANVIQVVNRKLKRKRKKEASWGFRHTGPPVCH